MSGWRQEIPEASWLARLPKTASFGILPEILPQYTRQTQYTTGKNTQHQPPISIHIDTQTCDPENGHVPAHMQTWM